MTSFSDIELWALVKQDDLKAFNKLYEKYWENCYSTCYWHLLDQEATKDLVQDLFIDLWDKRKQIDITETVERYFVIACRNKVLNHIRALNVRKKYLNVITNEIPDSAGISDQQNTYRELEKLYFEEISKLPQRMKEIYVLIKETKLSITETAKKLSISEQTVKNQLGTASKKIRTGLEYYKLMLLSLALCLILL